MLRERVRAGVQRSVFPKGLPPGLAKAKAPHAPGCADALPPQGGAAIAALGACYSPARTKTVPVNVHSDCARKRRFVMFAVLRMKTVLRDVTVLAHENGAL